MKAHVIDEPELEFRARNRHIDPRYGIAVYGPADADSPTAPSDITVGLVGPAAAVDGMRGWLERCQMRKVELSRARLSPVAPNQSRTWGQNRLTRPQVLGGLINEYRRAA